MVRSKPPQDERKRYNEKQLRLAFHQGRLWDPGPGRDQDTLEAADEAFQNWLDSVRKPYKVTLGYCNDEDDPPQLTHTRVHYVGTPFEGVALLRELAESDEFFSVTIEWNQNYGDAW